MIRLFALLLLTPFLYSNDLQKSYQTLKNGLDYLPAKGTPGTLLIYSDSSFPVLTSLDKKKGEQIAIAASHYEKGKVVAVTHESFFNPEHENRLTFLKNSLRWFKPNLDLHKIKIGHRNKKLKHPAFSKLNFHHGSFQDLKGVDVWIINSHKIESKHEIEFLRQHVKQGGGILISGIGWAWKTYMSKGKSLDSEFKGNQLINHFGLTYTDESIRMPSNKELTFNKSPSLELNLNHTFKLLKDDPSAKSIPASSLFHIEKAIHGLASKGNSWMDSFMNWLHAQQSKGLNDFSTPVAKKQILKRLTTLAHLKHLKSAPAQDIKAHPSVNNFPGVPDTPYQLIRKTVNVNPRHHGWISTGTYAVAGEPIKIGLPPSLLNKVSCRIGAHKDSLKHLDKWKRFPEITLQQKLTQKTNTLNSAFGGLVYLVFDKSVEKKLFNIPISNIIEAPLYVHGKTDLKEWNSTIKNFPAPWGEVTSNKIAITVPSQHLKKLTKPDQLMNTWDQILDLCADLAQIPTDRERPERIVCDKQISAGYMHSGYPIMTWMDQEKNLIDQQNLLDGNWGFYHELGHNHQKKSWTFEGTTEVTCNLFSLYVFEKLCGIPSKSYKRTSGKIRDLRVKHYIEKPNYELWKKNPWLALDMYVMLQQEFGWEPFKNIFKHYEDLEKPKHPKTDLKRREQWMILFSNQVQRNLGPFFKSWGFELSSEAYQAISTLPTWNNSEILNIYKEM